jgi:hypothetical protein
MSRIEITEDLVCRICERIAAGESLVRICKSEAMPSYSTVMKWLTLHADFAERYARAREDQADTLADEIIDIADSDPDPQRARVRVDARKWVASKLKPKKYGDKTETTLQGPEGSAIQIITTDHDRAAALAFTLRKGLPG